VLWRSWGFHLRFSLHIGVTGPRSPQEPESTSRRFYAGCRAGSKHIPQERLHHCFDIIYMLSTHHQRFTFVRLFEPYLIGSRPTFSHLAHHHIS
ncbi:hypothetical protein ACJQU2_004290, partial [Shigella sonnei]